MAVELLADPRVRLGAGAAGVLITAHAARVGTVGPGEARAFRAVNGLPDCSTRPCGSSCSSALSAPCPPWPAAPGWPATGAWRPACSPTGAPPGPWPSWSSGTCSGPAPRCARRRPRPRPPARRARLPVRPRRRRHRAGRRHPAAPQPRLRRRDPRDHVSGRPVRIYVGATCPSTSRAASHSASPSTPPSRCPQGRLTADGMISKAARATVSLTTLVIGVCPACPVVGPWGIPPLAPAGKGPMPLAGPAPGSKGGRNDRSTGTPGLVSAEFQRIS